MLDRRSGFSLVELSIVLVILGLLVGGVLAGQALIRASELRAVPREAATYRTAMLAFRDKYFALPGDMANATGFWGTATACPGDSTSPGTGTATCNGDASRAITPDAASSNETFRFWQHLANAGMAEGSFSGVTNSTTGTDMVARLGHNVPQSRIVGAGWSIQHLPSADIASTSYFEGNYGHVFSFGGVSGTNATRGGVLPPIDAYSIDEKMDDGLPATGQVRTLESLGGTCTDLAASASLARTQSAYHFSLRTPACSLLMAAGL